jgi:ankyrin repeat protein
MGDRQLAETIIDLGFDVHHRHIMDQTPLLGVLRHRADGRYSLTRKLLSAGANVNVAAKDLMTPLMWAHDYALVDLLLDKGARVNARSSHGFTPLMTTVINRNDAHTVGRLASAGANINAVDVDGRTALIHAAESRSDRADVITALLRNGADPTIRDKRGNTALTYAKRNGRGHEIELLARAVSDVKVASLPIASR